MNVGPTAVIEIWLKIVWYTCWPLIITPAIYFIFRKRIQKKYLFIIVGTLACYLIIAAVELLSPLYLDVFIQYLDKLTDSNGIGLSLMILNTSKTVFAVILLLLLTRWKKLNTV